MAHSESDSSSKEKGKKSNKIDENLLSFKTAKLDPFLDKIKSSDNLDIMHVIGKQILERADQMRESLKNSAHLKSQSREIVKKATEMTSQIKDQTISKVFKKKSGTRKPSPDDSDLLH